MKYLPNTSDTAEKFTLQAFVQKFYKEIRFAVAFLLIIGGLLFVREFIPFFSDYMKFAPDGDSGPHGIANGLVAVGVMIFLLFAITSISASTEKHKNYSDVWTSTVMLTGAVLLILSAAFYGLSRVGDAAPPHFWSDFIVSGSMIIGGMVLRDLTNKRSLLELWYHNLTRWMFR